MILVEGEANVEAETASNAGDATTEKTDGKNKDKDNPTEDFEDWQFWFCNTCNEIPRQVSQMIKLLSDVQKNMKNMKKSLHDMKNKVSSVEAVELQPELPERETPPVTKTHGCCTNSSRKLHDNCKINEQRLTSQHNEDEIASDLNTQPLIIEENIALKRENSHLKDRLSIMERVLDQIVRDHENKRKETYEERWKQPVKKMKVRKFDRHSKALTTQNRYEIISDESEDENSSCDEDPEVIEYRKDLTQRKQRSRGNNRNDNSNDKTKRPPKPKKTQQEGRDKVIVVGDSQLHNIEEEKLSSKDVKVLVRSKGGLTVEEVTGKSKDLIKEDPNEVIIHVGINNCERDEVDDIISKYKDVGNVIRKSSRVTFSSIIRRADKPDLNAKIAEINTELRNLCLCNGYDFIDNNNIGCRHLNRGKLHINRDSQRRLALNFINHLKGY